MRGKLKIGDVVEFTFAGITENGTITEISGETYKIHDGRYTYPVNKKLITKKHKKEI